MKFKKVITLLLKITIMVISLYYVGTKVDYRASWKLIQQANFLWIILGFIGFILSQIVSSFRLNVLFRKLNIHISEWNNIKLYLLGMFYNLFLPGGIGGDAYKVLKLSNEYKTSKKNLIKAVLIDRLFGLLALSIILVILFFFVDFKNNYSLSLLQKHTWLSIFLISIGILLFFLLVKYLFSIFFDKKWKATGLSLTLQFAQVFSIFCILRSLEIDEQIKNYLFLFPISSIAGSVVPTIGGIGAREFIFTEGAAILNLSAEDALATSALFFVMTSFTSLWGIIFALKENLIRYR